jgi:WD40 repeat protein
MFRWLAVLLVLAGGTFALVAALVPAENRKALLGFFGQPAADSTAAADRSVPGSDPAVSTVPQDAADGSQATVKPREFPEGSPDAGHQPIIIPGCTLTSPEPQEVPSEKDGKVLRIATEVKKGDKGPFKITDDSLASLRKDSVPESTVSKLNAAKDMEFETWEPFAQELARVLDKDELERYRDLVIKDTREGPFKITDASLASLAAEHLPEAVLAKLGALKERDFETRESFLRALGGVLTPEEVDRYREAVLDHTNEEWFGFLAIQTTAADPSAFFFAKDPNTFYRPWREGDRPEPGKTVVARQPRRIRKLHVGQWVNAGDLVAIVNPSVAFSELAVAAADLDAAQAEYVAAGKLKDAARVKYEAYHEARIRSPGSISEEEYRKAKVEWDKAVEDEKVKGAAVLSVQAKLNKAATTLQMYEIHASVSGVIKTVYKHPGEAIKPQDPLLLIQNPRKLRVEGLLDVQEALKLRVGMQAEVEASRPETPSVVFSGHHKPVTCVAVSKARFRITEPAMAALAAAGVPPEVLSGLKGTKQKDFSRPELVEELNKVFKAAKVVHPDQLERYKDLVLKQTVAKGHESLVVSGSEDSTLRGWTTAGHPRWELPLSAVPRALACSPEVAPDNLVLFGDDAGVLRLLNLDDHQALVREMASGHTGRVNSVAFSPDGSLCASGGADHALCLWDTASGNKLCRIPEAHRYEVTAVQFAGPRKLVTAGANGSLVVWDITDTHQLVESPPPIDGRTNDVSYPGVSPDGKTVLYNQGREMRLVSLENRQIEGQLTNPSDSQTFTDFALFAPDGKTILTNASAGRLQLWRVPASLREHAAELRQLIWTSGVATCAAFAPDSTFAVTGTKDHRVLLWDMPSEKEVKEHLMGRLSLVERSIDTRSRQVRVWALVDNPDQRLIAGSPATMVVPVR